MKRLLWLGLAVAAAAASAQAPYPSDLPPRQIAERAIREAPVARAGEALVRAEQSNRARLEAGPYEWAVRAGVQQRTVRLPSEHRLNEWDVALERPLRLPTKAAADRELGVQGVAQAQVAQGDALHETARSLLKSWFGWLREREALTQWREQVALLERQRQATERRAILGDASKMELLLADAELAQAKASEEQAKSRTEIAASSLTRRFPQVPLPPNLNLTDPLPLEGDFPSWREALLEHNHELALAREESKRARLLASRAGAERLPDPLVAVRYASERAGEERVVGMSIAIPLPGQARRAQHEASRAQAEAAALREAGTLARLEAEANATYVAALSGYEHWHRSRNASQRMTEAADLVARAHVLGESPLSDVLAARRRANEASLAARAAQIDALEARYRLLLDAHRIWDIER